MAEERTAATALTWHPECAECAEREPWNAPVPVKGGGFGHMVGSAAIRCPVKP